MAPLVDISQGVEEAQVIGLQPADRVRAWPCALFNHQANRESKASSSPNGQIAVAPAPQPYSHSASVGRR